MIEPTYQDDCCTLYLADCRDVLPELEAESIDMVLTSPPYGKLRDYNGYSFDFCKIADELWRLIKPGGVVVWIVGDETIDGSESGVSFMQALYFKEIGFRLHDTMIYMKAGPAYPAQTRYYQVFEYMFIFSKGAPKTFNPLKDRENRWYGQKWSKVRTRREKDGTLSSQKWYADEGNPEGVRFNIWQYANGYGNHGDDFAHEHPASFPEALAEDHILSWSNPGDTILDPMMGSGTTGKMALAHKCNFIGIDISRDYVDIAKRRIIEAQMQLRLGI